MTPKSLKQFFITYITVAVVIVNLIVLTIYGYKNYEKDKLQLHQNIKEISNAIMPVFINYLWTLDYKSLRNFSSTILSSNPFICSITIYDEKNNVIFSKNKNTSCNINNTVNLHKKIFFNNYYIGKVNFIFSKRIITEHLKKIILLTGFITVALSLILIFIIVKIFHNLIDEPIMDIANNLLEINKRNYSINLKNTNIIEFDTIISNLKILSKNLEKKEIENRELTEKLYNILNSLPVAILIADKNGHYIEINDTFCHFLKLPKEEVFKTPMELLSGGAFSTDNAFEVLNQTLKTGSSTFEWKLKDKDGNILDMLVISKRLTIGKEDFALFAATDVTYLKKLEKEVIKKEKLESVGMLAGGIAHDFNNILTSISGGIELIQLFLEKGDISKVKQRLQLLFKSIDRAKFLTNQLLTFSKGGAPVRKKVENIHNLLKDVADFILSGSEVVVEYSFCKDLKPVEIDVDQFALVIQNIILNAKQAMDNKGTIYIKTENQEDNIIISIRDSGKGIDKEKMDKIWEPFYTDKTSGTGLGLSIAYSIIKKHNGEIKVFSEKGKFTEFKIILPAVKDSPKRKDIKSLHNSIYKTTSMNILILEDEEEIRETLKEMLQILDHNVETASTGEEAIKKFQQGKFHLVILDLTIKGGMGGMECIKRLRTINQNLKAIVYSGYYNVSIMEEHEKYGFCAAIKKPFKLSDIKNAIEKCIKKAPD